MSERAPYSRVYWSVLHDPKFDGIRDKPVLIGSWMLMLIVADMAWPAPAYQPPTVSRASAAVLAEAGLVDPLPGGMFRVHGLDAERTRRRDAARTGPKRDPDGAQTGGTRDPNGSQAEPSLDEPRRAETPRDPADIYWQLTGKYPAGTTLEWIDDITSKYGADAVIRHLTAAHIADRSTRTVLGRTTDLLRAEARQLDRKEAATEQAALREKRAKPRVMEPWQVEYRAAVEQQYRDLEAS